MIIKTLTTTIRTPTVQYGYFEHTYEVEIFEDEESVTDVLRHVHSCHRQAMKEVDQDANGYPIPKHDDEPPWDVDPLNT